MSLFNTVKFWGTRCGVDDENESNELFDHQCICVSALDSNEGDRILVGNHAGYFWAFEPNSSYRRNSTPDKENEVEHMDYNPIDQLLEIKLSQPILQIGVGKLVS